MKDKRCLRCEEKVKEIYKSLDELLLKGIKLKKGVWYTVSYKMKIVGNDNIVGNASVVEKKK